MTNVLHIPGYTLGAILQGPRSTGILYFGEKKRKMFLKRGICENLFQLPLLWTVNKATDKMETQMRWYFLVIIKIRGISSDFRDCKFQNFPGEHVLRPLLEKLAPLALVGLPSRVLAAPLQNIINMKHIKHNILINKNSWSIYMNAKFP